MVGHLRAMRSSPLTDVSTTDHHSEYLARALDALTPEGHERVDELLDQLAEVVGDHEAVARFAAARKPKPTPAGWRPTQATSPDARSARRS